MNIIGKTKEGLLLSATNNEVARLLGYYFESTSQGCPELKPGMEINVNAMFEQLYAMKTVERTLTEAASKLRCCADTLTIVAPVANEIVEQNH